MKNNLTNKNTIKNRARISLGVKKDYSFNAEVWLWPGVGGWHFVNVPDKISKEIRASLGKGMVKIKGIVGKTEWNTALFPYKNPKGEFGYLVSIKSVVRKKEQIFQGDKLKLKFKIL